MIIVLLWTGMVSICHCKVWVSMSVCADTNTDFHGKTHFPYRLAAVYSTMLWKNITGYDVIVGIVVSDNAKHNHPEHVDILQAALQKAGAVTYIQPTLQGYSCPTVSQLARMFAYTHTDLIHPSDIIITADVDAFPDNPKIMTPLADKTKLIWIWQHEYTEKSGETFPMSFLATYSTLWAMLIDPTNLQNVDAILKYWEAQLAAGHKDDLAKWGLDQSICSKAILQHGLCNVKNPRIYSLVQLHQPKDIDNTLCLTGFYRNSGGEVGKTWSHFSPTASRNDLKKAFEKLAKDNGLNFDIAHEHLFSVDNISDRRRLLR